MNNNKLLPVVIPQTKTNIIIGCDIATGESKSIFVLGYIQNGKLIRIEEWKL